MADQKTYTIRINGVEESIKQVDALKASLDNMEERVKALQERSISVTASVSAPTVQESKSSGRVSQYQEESKLLKEIEQTERKIAEARSEDYQRLEAEKDILKEIKEDTKQRAAQERLVADTYSKDTLSGMRAKLSDLKRVISTTSIDDDAFGGLVKQADELNSKIKEVEESYGQFGRNVGNYKGSLEGEFNKVVIAVGGVERSFNSAREAYRSLKNERDSMALSGQKETEQFKELDRTVKTLESDIKDLGKSSSAMDALLDAMESITAMASVSNGLSALFGFDNSAIEESIQKLVALQNVLKGLETIQKQFQTGEFLGGMFKGFDASVDKATKRLLIYNRALLGTSKSAKVAAGGIKVFGNALKWLSRIGIVGMLTIAMEAIEALVDMFSKGNEEAEKLKEEQLEMASETGQAYAKATSELAKYTNMVKNFNGNAQQEKKLVDELNSKFGDQLGTYKDLAKWKQVLIEKSADYIEMMKMEAEAAVLLKRYQEAYEDVLKTDVNAANGEYSHWYQSAQQDKEAAERAKAGARAEAQARLDAYEEAITKRQNFAKSHGLGLYSTQELTDTKNNGKKAVDAVKKVEDEIISARINAMEDGLRKTLAQLDYEKRKRIEAVKGNGKAVQAIENLYEDKRKDAIAKYRKETEKELKEFNDRMAEMMTRGQLGVLDAASNNMVQSTEAMIRENADSLKKLYSSYGANVEKLTDETKRSMGLLPDNFAVIDKNGLSPTVKETKKYISLLQDVHKAESELYLFRRRIQDNSGVKTAANALEEFLKTANITQDELEKLAGEGELTEEELTKKYEEEHGKRVEITKKYSAEEVKALKDAAEARRKAQWEEANDEYQKVLSGGTSASTIDFAKLRSDAEKARETAEGLAKSTRDAIISAASGATSGASKSFESLRQKARETAEQVKKDAKKTRDEALEKLSGRTFDDSSYKAKETAAKQAAKDAETAAKAKYDADKKAYDVEKARQESLKQTAMDNLDAEYKKKEELAKQAYEDERKRNDAEHEAKLKSLAAQKKAEMIAKDQGYYERNFEGKDSEPTRATLKYNAKKARYDEIQRINKLISEGSLTVAEKNRLLRVNEMKFEENNRLADAFADVSDEYSKLAEDVETEFASLDSLEDRLAKLGSEKKKKADEIAAQFKVPEWNDKAELEKVTKAVQDANAARDKAVSAITKSLSEARQQDATSIKDEADKINATYDKIAKEADEKARTEIEKIDKAENDARTESQAKRTAAIEKANADYEAEMKRIAKEYKEETDRIDALESDDAQAREEARTKELEAAREKRKNRLIQIEKDFKEEIARIDKQAEDDMASDETSKANAEEYDKGLEEFKESYKEREKILKEYKRLKDAVGVAEMQVLHNDFYGNNIADYEMGVERAKKALQDYIDELNKLNPKLDLTQEKIEKFYVTQQLEGENYTDDLQKQFVARLGDRMRYYDQVVKAQNDAAKEIRDNDIEAAGIAYSSDTKDIELRLSAETKSFNDFYKTRVKNAKATGESIKAIEAEAEENKQKMKVAYDKEYEALDKQYQARLLEIDNSYNDEVRRNNADAFSYRIQEYRDFMDKISQVQADQPITDNKGWEIVNVKETKKNVQQVEDSMKEMSNRILEDKRELQEQFDKHEISFDDFSQAQRELSDLETSITSTLRTTQEQLRGFTILGLRFDNILGQKIQSLNTYIQQGFQAVQTIMTSINDYNDYLFEKEQDAIDKENEALEDKLSEQEDIVAKHKEAIDSIEDELSTARGDRRQHLIDSLNAEMAAQRKALAEQKRAEKEKKKLEEKQEELDKKRKQAEYKRNLLSILVSTAMATANGLATQPFVPLGIAMGALATSLGMVQYALAAKAKPYAHGGQLDGGVAVGNRHSQGGIKVLGGKAEIEGGEFVTNRISTEKNVRLLEFINSKKKRLDVSDIVEFYASKRGLVKENISKVRSRYASGGQLPLLRNDVSVNDRFVTALEDYADRPIMVEVTEIMNKADNVRNVQVMAGLKPSTSV